MDRRTLELILYYTEAESRYDHAYPCEGLRDERRPSPADDVQAEDGEDVGGELEEGGDRERPVDGVVNVANVADVAVEHARDAHPKNEKERKRKMFWDILHG